MTRTVDDRDAPRSVAPTPAGSLELAETLQLVADTIVESLGFAVAVINLVDGEAMVVAAVCGPAEVRAALLDDRQPLACWDAVTAASERWGRLLFLDHRSSLPVQLATWVPDLPLPRDEQTWHPEDALFAPLTSSTGSTLGMLSVDLPRDGRRPGRATCHALEAFAVTASLAIEHAALAAESRRGVRRFRAVFDSSPIAIALLGPDGRFTSVNDAYCRFLDRPPSALLGQSPFSFTHPDDLPPSRALASAVRSAEADASEALGAPPVEKRYLLPDGSVVWGRLHLAALGSADEPGVVIAQVEDITERKRAEQQLVQQAHFDPLTSLPNRASSMARLTQVLAGDAAPGTATVVFFCDLDGLKQVNDRHGHAVGDAYLREVGRRIRAGLRTQDTVGRLSGDEFVAILPGLAGPDEAGRLADRVLAAVREPLLLGELRFTPSMSLGLAVARPGTSAEELLAQADTAMYHAKTSVRGSWRAYAATMRAGGRVRLPVGVSAASA